MRLFCQLATPRNAGVALVGLLVCNLPSVHAQAPEIGGLLPAGGPRGTATQVRIDGKNLAGSKIWVTGAGVSVKSVQVAPSGDTLTANIAVEPGALLGPHEIRITNPKGVSNGSRFWVDVYPNHVIEKPMAEGAEPILLNPMAPVVINSRIAARAGRDRFTITAQAGDVWVFDCFADRIRSRFDPVMELRDEAGVSLRLVQSTWESDPRFRHKFAKAGRYTLIVRDSEYKGGPGHTYRLLTGKLPYVESFSPRGQQSGQSLNLALNGPDLGVRSASVAIPAGAPSGTFWAEVHPEPGEPVLVPLLVCNDTVLNAGSSSAVQPLLALPTSVDGMFTSSSKARFSFKAAAKARILFDLVARRIGSRIDGHIRVVDIAGKELAANDDAAVLSKEARVEFTAPADGEYFVEVRDVEEKTGPDCYYRLKASTVEPDFKVSIATDRLTVAKGATLAVPVTVERIGGFTGPVEVWIDGLPAGLTAAPITVPADKPIELKIVATADAQMLASEVHIRGKAAIGGKTITREAPAWDKYEHRSIDLLLSVEYTYTRPFHIWEQLLLSVTEAPPPKK